MTQKRKRQSCSLWRTQWICIVWYTNSNRRVQCKHVNSIIILLSRGWKNKSKKQFSRLDRMVTGYSSTISILHRIGCLFWRILCLNGKLDLNFLQGSECGLLVYQDPSSQHISFNHQSKWPFNHQVPSNKMWRSWYQARTRKSLETPESCTTSTSICSLV